MFIYPVYTPNMLRILPTFIIGNAKDLNEVFVPFIMIGWLCWKVLITNTYIIN